MSIPEDNAAASAYFAKHDPSEPASPDEDDYAEVEWTGSETAVIESQTNPWLRTPGGRDIDLRQFAELRGGVDFSDECDTCGTLMRGVIEAMDTDFGIQRCDQCDLYEGDLEAARALRDTFMPAGTTIWFFGTN